MKRAIVHDRRNFLEEDAVAQQAAAHAGDESENERAHHVVASRGRRPYAGEGEQEYGGEIEPDRQQKGDARHGRPSYAC